MSAPNIPLPMVKRRLTQDKILATGFELVMGFARSIAYLVVPATEARVSIE